MLLKKAPAIKPSEITDKKLYMNRRQFIIGSTAVVSSGLLNPPFLRKSEDIPEERLKVTKRGEYTVPERLTPYEEATSYTNFYEFSTGKRSVKELSQTLRTHPWTLSVEGYVEKPRKYDIEELIHMFPLEERVYRWRCVEAWSMVIPWIGFPLAEFIKKCKPTTKARFVEFVTLYAPDQMPGQLTNVLKWPYMEGLRMDEALHPLALVAVGMYDEVLPNQNGAPVRLVAPWKYGFKSIKSVLTVRFVEKMPNSSWRRKRPEEYGFYANVNPNVDHPRWNQTTERRIGEEGRRKTLMFNGYADQVGHLYSGMNLKRFY